MQIRAKLVAAKNKCCPKKKRGDEDVEDEAAVVPIMAGETGFDNDNEDELEEVKSVDTEVNNEDEEEDDESKEESDEEEGDDEDDEDEDEDEDEDDDDKKDDKKEEEEEKKEEEH